jgi:hypothetical protein
MPLDLGPLYFQDKDPQRGREQVQDTLDHLHSRVVLKNVIFYSLESAVGGRVSLAGWPDNNKPQARSRHFTIQARAIHN